MNDAHRLLMQYERLTEWMPIASTDTDLSENRIIGETWIDEQTGHIMVNITKNIMDIE